MPYYFLITVMKQSWVALRITAGSGLGSGDGVSVLDFVVGRIFLNYCLRWPFVVAGKIVRCLEMRYYVSPSQVVRGSFFIAWINVKVGRLKHAACRNWANYFWSCSSGKFHYLPVMVD